MQIKIEAKSDEYQQAAMDGSGMESGVYGAGAVKEEPATESTEDPMSPASSPPRKRYRLMAATLPSSTPPSSFPPNGSGIGSDHHQLHHQSHQQQHHHQQHDWHRNHRSDHHPHSGYGQPVWPNAGWINTSYPVGLAQLDESSYDSPDVAYERDSSFSPLVGVSVGRASSPTAASSPNHVQQRRLLLRRKQHHPPSAMEVTDLLTIGRYQSTEGVQRVPDSFITMPPELSPLGYVLTPAPTPPDAEEGAPLSYHTSNVSAAVEIEQRVPASLPSEPDGANSNINFVGAGVLSGQQHEVAAVENQQMLLLPANRHYVYHHAANTPSMASASSAATPAESACDPTHPTLVVDYQAPTTPTNMNYPKP